MINLSVKVVLTKLFKVVYILSFLLPICSTQGGINDEQYIGCYQDNVDRDIGSGSCSTIGSMTITLCRTHCQQNGLTYAGAQYGTQCCCGDSYGKYGPSTICNMTCAGTSQDFCGNSFVNSVYSTCPIGRYGSSCNMECHCANQAPCFLSNGTCPNGCATGWTGSPRCNQTVSTSTLDHYGCYVDSRTVGLPPLYDDAQMTIVKCVDRCRTASGLYAGLQYGSQCFCGNIYSYNGSSNACVTRCSGDTTERCGGSYANDIYPVCQVGYYGELCTGMCHCAGNNGSKNCSMENGTCPSGGCTEGWMGTSCNARECSMANGNCDILETCKNELAGAGRSVSRCRCANGYNRTMEYQECQDIDECALGPPVNECDDASMGNCTNYSGSYNCSCQPGYENNSPQSCQDVDECALGPPDNQCSNESMGTCNNYLGSYNCTCQPGYENNGHQSCQDIDECALGPPDNQCNDTSMGKCINYPGSYNCSCESGYENNGSQRCQDIDECQHGPPLNQCDNVTGVCFNLPGSYNCTCHDGYKNPDSDSQSCQEIKKEPLPKPKSDTGAIVGAVVGSLVFVLIIAFLVGFYYFRVRGRSKKNVESDSIRSFADVSSTSVSTAGSQNASPTSRSLLKLSEIAAVTALTMQEEFNSVPMEADLSRDYATDEALKSKNKYRNIIPYDQNRVKLPQLDDNPQTDYINASYLTAHRYKKMIASHGPQKATVDDFWRMIWVENVGMIVMVTKCIESGKKKCEQYWPAAVDESVLFGDITVKTDDEDVFADYVVREFTLTMGKEKKSVCQCHFLGWPDHDVPSDAISILRFRQIVQKLTPKEAGVVVHCSAGVGRTGTFVAIDNLLYEAEKTSKLDVLKCLTDMRNERMHVVQTIQQYTFIYRLLNEFYVTGNTSVSVVEFKTKFASISSQRTKIDKEFEHLEKMKIYLTDDDKYDALLPNNMTKNRDTSIVPASRDRVFIITREKGRNDYINAVFCQSLRLKEAFIQTQLPLNHTVVDFWNMVNDYKCQLVVLFDADKAVPDFIPTTQDPLAFQNNEIHLKSEVAVVGGVSYEIRLTSKQSTNKTEESTYANHESGKIVIVVRLTSMKDKIFNEEAILSTYNMTKAKQLNRTPIVVMCRNGCTYSSVYICASNLFDMIDCRKEVDVFQVVHDLRVTRPQAIESVRSYEQLYALSLAKLKQSEDGPSFHHVDNQKNPPNEMIYANLT